MQFLLVLLTISVNGALANPIMFGQIPSIIPDPTAAEDTPGNLAIQLDNIEISTELSPELRESISSVYESLPDIPHWTVHQLQEAKNPQNALLLDVDQWDAISHFCITFRNDVGVVLTPQTLSHIRENKYTIYSETISNIVTLWNICELSDYSGSSD